MARTIAQALAERKARKTLRRNLTAEQQADYGKYGHFFVEKNGRIFRFGDRYRAGVYETKDRDHVTYEFYHCIVFHHDDWLYMFKRPDGNPPEADSLLAQLLMLKYAEDKFFETAHTSSWSQDHPMNPEQSQAVRDAFDECVGVCEFPPHAIPESELGSYWIGRHSPWPKPADYNGWYDVEVNNRGYKIPLDWELLDCPIPTDPVYLVEELS